MKFILVCMILLTGMKSGFAQKDTIPDTKYFPPTGEEKKVAIMMLGGSEGGLPNYYNTELFTKLGYPCFIVGYFGTRNTPDRLEMIPLEYFEAAFETFKSFPGMLNKKIVLFGGSKGGELALLLASRYKQIEGVIAVVPSSVVFQGLGGRLLSSWSYKGESVPFVPYARFDFRKIVNSQYGELYKLTLEQKEAVEKAAIRVENINGPVLLLTGKSDTMWPSAQMGEMVVKRLENSPFSYDYKHFSYEDAGHTLNEGYMMGGTAEGNKFARIDSEQRILEFLSNLSK